MLNFWRDKSGNFAMLTAILAVPLFGAAGLALDFSQALAVKEDLQQQADATALAAVAKNSPYVAEARKMGGDGPIIVAGSSPTDLFKKEKDKKDDFDVKNVTLMVKKMGNVVESSVELDATVNTSLSSILGKDLVTVSVKSTGRYQTEKYMNFYLLLDNTPSMGVGATPQDVAKMVANTPDQCAFACHDVKSGAKSYYQLAKDLNVTTRINVVGKATASLMDTAADTQTVSNQFRMAVYTFGEKAEDTKLLEVVPLTSSLSDAKSKSSKIDLMSIPYQGYNNDQQTDIDRALTQISSKMGLQGDGNSSATPEKVLFFVSDGVGDSYKPTTCTKRTTNGRCQEPIDTRLCTALKSQGYRIAVLYTTYLPLPTNGWYNDWIRPFQSEISTRMQDCASQGLFFEVSPTQGISDAMSALFKRAVSSPRLSS
ncbi:TadE/TadG family type IV pilus assembly protein [Agrobacterium sp. SORGH_AS 787]|uniref:TadE/TadG family type IV pilus assembly protein n=1 Tax=Agrobacterium sp. SORGH_AS 787 TaxID=3041775 RepID=UPI002781640F|nr:Flp pilus assembly protein TadG [Rhizobium sp. SORGH_AS_0787]